MCDTFVALQNSTLNGSTIFAKNSDRDPNEAHQILIVPGDNHDAGTMVKCTNVTIPQVKKTNTVFLSKPFWIWGAEMGVNEHGVIIGNEALFTKSKPHKEPGLIGMDTLRLALERSDSARSAVQVIIELIEQYGQSGNCGYQHPIYYENSYLIADAEEAWVLETVGREWALERVVDTRSISNAITIGEKWDSVSKNLVTNAQKNGWVKPNQSFHFGRDYSDLIYTRFADGHRRQSCTTKNLIANRGRMDVKTAMTMLRQHEDKNSNWSPAGAITGADVCMHAGWGPIRLSQTTGSMVVEILNRQITIWATGTSAPCTGIFKPIWFESGMPEIGPLPTGTYDPKTLWWLHEKLHRILILDYPQMMAEYSVERDLLEDGFITKSKGIKRTEERKSISQECFDISRDVTQRWTEKFMGQNRITRVPFYYQLFWKQNNKQAELS